MTINKSAQDHIAKAKEYIAKGDEYYIHAASEMELAREAGATWVEIGDALGRSERWCRAITSWAKLPANERSSTTAWESSDKIDLRKAKAVLRDPDKVQDVVDALPREAVYEIEKAVANRLGSPITGASPVDATPRAVVQAFDSLPSKERERVVQDIVQHREFAEAVNASPAVRDEMVVKVFGTPSARKERAEENERKAIESNPVHAWRPIVDAFGDANRALTHALDGLVKLVINRGVDPEEDPLGVAHSRAEMVGRSIYEIEMAWGETPITDKIEELRGSRV